MFIRVEAFRRASLLLFTGLGIVALSLAGCGKLDESDRDSYVLVQDDEDKAIDPVSVRLIVDRDDIGAGDTFRLGVLMGLIPRAHVYWRNPGDSGLPMEVVWTLPEGFTAGPLQWPAPELFYEKDIDDTSYGYKDEVLLFAEITAPDSLDEAAALHFGAKTSWLVCLVDGQCIPGGRPLELTLDGPGSDAYSPDSYELYRSQMARSVEDTRDLLRVKFVVNPRALILSATPPWRFFADAAGPFFFPYEGDPWKPAGAGALSTSFETSADGKSSGEFVATLENSETGDVEMVSVRWGAPPDSD